MTRGRPKRHPSARNLELYHELVCEGRRQVEVASRFRVSQPRVATVRRSVCQWVDDALPPELAAESSGRRLHLAIAFARMQLQAAYGRYLEHFGGATGAEAYGHWLAASQAGILPPDAVAGLPRRDLVASAVRMARELMDLARVARRGPYFKLPELAPEAHASGVQARV
jgi:hypothetical protein